MAPVQDERNAAIEFGEFAATFLQSPIGSFLIKRADAEEREALEKLAIVNPFDQDAIRLLQFQAWRANSFAGWLQEAINAAVAAHQDQQHDERLPEPQ